jgi:hypothetical protein
MSPQRSRSLPLAQGALAGSFVLWAAAYGLERLAATLGDGNVIYWAPEAQRWTFVPFALFVTILFGVVTLQSIGRLIHNKPLQGVGAAVAFAGAALVPSCVGACSSLFVGSSHVGSTELDGADYLLSCYKAMDGDGFLILYQCDSLELRCSPRRRVPFSQSCLPEDLRLVTDPAQHLISVESRLGVVFTFPHPSVAPKE